MSSTFAGDKDPKETVIDTGIGIVKNVDENVDVSSQERRKQPNFANARSSRRRQTDEQNLSLILSKIFYTRVVQSEYK